MSVTLQLAFRFATVSLLLLRPVDLAMAQVATPSLPTESKELRVGVLLPLSGEYSTWGERVRQGLLLAAKDTKHRFSFDFQDEGSCDPKLSLAGAQKLFTSKVRIVFVGCLAGTKAIGSVASRHGSLLLSTGLLDNEVFNQKLPIINLATQLSTEARFLAALVARSEVKRVALVRWPDAFGEEFARALTIELDKRSIAVALDDDAAVRDNDFRTLIVKMRHANVSAVITQLGDAAMQIFMRQLKDAHLPLQVYSSYAVEGNSAPVPVLEGLRYTYPQPTNDAAELAKFVERFESTYGKGTLPSANSLFAYDGVRILDTALESCQPTEVECLSEHFKELTYRGISGDVSFNPDGSNIRAFGAKIVEGGAYRWIRDDSATAK